MKPYKIGMITCSNATNELNCCSVSCFSDFNKRAGSFKDYPQEVPLRLVGIISCASCPTRVYPEKIIRRVESLVAFGTQYLHLSNCMVAFCPFIKSYVNVIKNKYPEVEIVKGTHTAHISDENFREKLVCAFETKRNMPDIILGKI